jgi:hypothetical protein
LLAATIGVDCDVVIHAAWRKVAKFPRLHVPSSFCDRLCLYTAKVGIMSTEKAHAAAMPTGGTCANAGCDKEGAKHCGGCRRVRNSPHYCRYNVPLSLALVFPEAHATSLHDLLLRMSARFAAHLPTWLRSGLPIWFSSLAPAGLIQALALTFCLRSFTITPCVLV